MRRSALWLLPSLTLGCVSATESPTDLAGAGDLASTRDFAGVVQDLAGATDLAMTGGDLASAYPAGPYGNQVGDVIPPLSWIGYDDPKADVLANTEAYASFSMDDLRRSGAKYGIVHLSDFL